MIHTLEPDERTLHGHFSRDRPPVLTIDPGDTVVFRTLDARWGLEPHHPEPGRPRREFAHGPDDDGHALTGPVAIRGAAPGQTLAVEVGALVPAAYGACFAGGPRSALNERLGIVGDGVVHTYTLDLAAMTGTSSLGRTVQLRPFLGVMGMPPDAPGIHSTIPPRMTGGNLDCRELVSGSTLYLPIAVAGGLFSTGDGHAAQGDGESSGTAIECPMERAELTFTLRDDLPLSTPVARTPAGWVTLGVDEDLDAAALIALNAMLELLGRELGLSRRDALAVASVEVDLRVTQTVNEVQGVHALWRDGGAG